MKRFIIAMFLCSFYCLNAKTISKPNCTQYPNYYQTFEARYLVYSNDWTSDGATGTISIDNNYLYVNFDSAWSYNQSIATGVIGTLNIYPVIEHIELGSIYSNGQETGYFAKIENNELIIYTVSNLPTVYYNALFFGIGIDLNCAANWFKDMDFDGYGDPNSIPITDCYQPYGYVSNTNDCNDQNNTITTEQNWYFDSDNDGFGDSTASPVFSCSKPSDNFVANNLDSCPTIYSTTGNGCPENPALVNKNYIHTITPTTEAADISSLSNDQKIESIAYFDGLGRPMQNVSIRAGGNNQDIITPIEYDVFARQEKDYLPYAETSNGGLYRDNALTDIIPFYQNNAKYENTANPYAKKAFEPSPLNRVLQQAAPGNPWSLANNQTIKFDYQANVANEVRLFKANASWDAIQQLYEIALSAPSNTYYAAGELYKTITKDENWTTSSGKNNTTEEFKDKEGRVILKKTYSDYKDTSSNLISSQTPHETYYVYDVYGNLTYVIPPKAVELLGNSSSTDTNLISTLKLNASNEPVHLSATNSITLSDGFHAQAGSTFLATIDPNGSVLDALCYQYKYDNKKRLVEKKLPGKQWEYIIYDKLDRVILNQDANLKAQNKWLFTKYDAFSRPVYTGEYSNSVSRVSLQTTVNSQATLFEIKQGANTINNVTIYYTNQAFPQTGIDLLTINYYDGYEFDINGGNSEVIGGIAPITNATGLATGTKNRILGSSAWTTNVIYYDAKGRTIYSYSKNDFLGTIQKVKSVLDFVGKQTVTTTEHVKGITHVTLVDNFTYDHAGRLKKQTQSINGSPAEVIAENTYDELGQLISKGVGNTDGNARLQIVDFAYNIRGWLKGINDLNSPNNDVYLVSGDLFGFKINYNNSSDPNKALYNGNISQTFWKTLGQDTGLKNYTYDYDALNRLTKAVSHYSGRYNESVSYDKNGNIISLLRNGHTDANASIFGTMDNLAYTYDSGNKLLKVVDNSGVTEGFKEVNTIVDDYTYDANGNIKTDVNKSITAITYNHLNLPVDISISGGTIHYDYDAKGVKQRKVVNQNTITSYAEGFQYEGIDLKFFPTSEGYVNHSNGIFEYIYQYKDHLGNNRLSYKNSPNGLVIVEENHYYPFGLQQKIPGSVYNNSNYKYKYNGKELQDELGLNMYDYGARNYDPAIGRFMNSDPMAEKRNWLSPYNYVQNNPILKIDPDGMLDGDYYTNDGSWLGNDGIDDQKVHVVNEGDYKPIGGGKTNIYKSTELTGVTNEILLAFASVIHAESGGSKEESYAIGNVTMNFVDGGGSTQLPTLEDVVMYDNKFAQGATQDNYTSFMESGDKNSKYAMGAAINAIGNSQGISGFSDYSNGANGWDGIDLISSKWNNSHRDYSWSEGSKSLLSKYKKDNNGGVDVSGFTYKKSGYQISATKIIGNTIYTKLTTGRGEKKQSNMRFN
jgi:RHS repeat-associated protein